MFKQDLKSVKVVQSHYYKEGSTLKLNLMVRNKANVIVKDKYIDSLEPRDAKSSLPTQKLPSQNNIEYHGCRVLISDTDQLKEDTQNDLESLEEEIKLMQSC